MRYIIACLLVICGLQLKAQYVDYGNDPAAIKWRVIETEHYSVTFPIESELLAKDYANILEKVFTQEKKTMQNKRKVKIPVILHPYNSRSNGMVAWAPKRMELLTNPVPDKAFVSNETTLALHESRHVVQLKRLDQGLLRPLYFILGEQTMGASSVFVPKWLFEGDAVVAETGMSGGGRGRQADFLMPYRASYDAGKFYSLDKWFLGSYKDFTYDYYALGYAMSAYARTVSGPLVWSDVFNDVTLWRGIPPFAVSLKHNTGMRPKQLFDATFKDLSKEWATLPYDVTDIDVLSPQSKNYTDYVSPVMAGDKIIAVKKSLTHPTALVSIENGKETRLTYLGSINSKLSVHGNKIYWTEFTSGIRWTHKSYSVVKQYNTETRKLKTITPRQHYYQPSVSDAGIAVYEPLPSGEGNIKLLDFNGALLKNYPVPQKADVKDLVLNSNGEITASVVGNKGSMLIKTEYDGWVGLTKPLYTNMVSLRHYNNGIIFESDYNGVSNIYSIDTVSMKISRLTGAKYGASVASVSNNKLIFADYTNHGYRLVSADIEPKQSEFNSPYKFKFAEALAAQEAFNADTLRYDLNFTSKKYRRGLNLLNFHSFMPFYINVDDITRSADFNLKDIMPGLTLLSQNRLNTFVSTYSYYYDYVNHNNHGSIMLRYTGWLPVLEFKADMGGSRDYFYGNETLLRSTNKPHLKLDFYTYIPFNFSVNQYNQGMQPFLGYTYENNVIGKLSGTDMQYLEGGIYFYRYLKPAVRDIFPRFGWQLWVRYAGHPLIDDFGKIYASRGVLFLPGAFKNHGIKLKAQFQYHDLSAKYQNIAYPFPKNVIDMPRGCYYYLFNNNVTTASADYSLPLAYPDFAIGSLVYLKRIRANMFYDFARSRVFAQTAYQNINQWGYGAELITEMNFLRISFLPCDVGIRVTNSSDRDLTFDFIFGVTL